MNASGQVYLTLPLPVDTGIFYFLLLLLLIVPIIACSVFSYLGNLTTTDTDTNINHRETGHPVIDIHTHSLSQIFYLCSFLKENMFSKIRNWHAALIKASSLSKCHSVGITKYRTPCCLYTHSLIAVEGHMATVEHCICTTDRDSGSRSSGALGYFCFLKPSLRISLSLIFPK